MKHKYTAEKAAEDADAGTEEKAASTSANDGNDLEYYLRRVRQLDREDREKRSKLTPSDLLRKRKMPTFNYRPRFAGDIGSESSTSPSGAESQEQRQHTRKRKMSRRFDIGDIDYMKPVPASKIMLYALAATLLLLWILL
ncbi:MAG: hypothetical protein SPJ13_03015 [Bacteroidales bacterium]|nr:hypothetical protein [Bacteroidales bacterium]